MFWTIFWIWIICSVAVNIILLGTYDKKKEDRAKLLRYELQLMNQELRRLKRQRQLTYLPAEQIVLDAQITEKERQIQEIESQLSKVQEEVDTLEHEFNRRFKKYAIWPVIIIGTLLVVLFCCAIGRFWYVTCGGFLLWHEDTFFGKLAMGLFSLVLLVIAIVGVIEVFRKN